jgi:hypothetical protein
MVTFVTILSLCVLFAPVGLVGQRVTRRVLGSGWLHASNAPSALFAKLALTPEKAPEGAEARARGMLREVPVEITVLTTSDRARGNLWVDVDLEGRVPSAVRASSVGRSLPSDGHADAADAVKLGDELFDRAFVVSGPQTLALATLTLEARELLMGLLDGTATRRWNEVHLEGAHLIARVALTEENQRIDELAAQVLDVAFAASRMRSTPSMLDAQLGEQAHETQSPLYRALCVRALLERAAPGDPREVAMDELCATSAHSELRLIHYERHPDAFDDDAIFELLNTVSTTHRDAATREWALDELARTFGARLIQDASRPMFQRVRLLRAMIAASIPEDELVALMRGVLAGAKTTARREFWGELLEQRWEGARALLGVERDSAPDETTRVRCVELCALLGGDACERFLLVELHSPFPSVQRATIEALGAIGGRTSFAPLSAIATSSSPFAPAAKVALAALAERVGEGSMGALSVSSELPGGDLSLLDEAGGLTPIDE